MKRYMFKTHYGLMSPSLWNFLIKRGFWKIRNSPTVIIETGNRKNRSTQYQKRWSRVGVIALLCISVTLFSCTAAQKQQTGETTQTLGTVTKTIGTALGNPIVSGVGDLLILVGGLFLGKKGYSKITKKKEVPK